MARPKRQRTAEVASVERPPTTRRRRSQVETAVGIGVRKTDDNKGKNENKSTASTMTIPGSNNPSTSKKNKTTTAVSTIDDPPIPKTTRSQTSGTLTTKPATAPSSSKLDVADMGKFTSNDPGNDHAVEDNEDDVKNEMTSQVDTNTRLETSISDVTTVTTKQHHNATLLSKAVHTTTPKSATTMTTTTTTRRSSSMNIASSTTSVTSTAVANATLPVPVVPGPITTTTTIVEASKTTSIEEENNGETNDLRIAESSLIVENLPTTAEAAIPDVSNDIPRSTNQRKEDVFALLRHRKLLLQRVRQCRNATQQRLSTAAIRSIDDEKETAIFTDTMKQVLSLARKQARLEQQREGGNTNASGSNKNNSSSTNVTLRRGNSVGKRMNAAISSLTGGGANNNNHSQQEQIVPQQLSSVMNNDDNPILGLDTMVGTSGDDFTASTKMNQMNSSTMVGNMLTTTKSTTTAGGNNLKKRSDSSMSRSLLRKSNIHRGGNEHQSVVQQRNNSAMAGTLDYVSNQQLSHSSTTGMKSGTGTHQQRMLQQQQQQQKLSPRVICPETMALRNRRDDIRSTLATLLQSRQHQKFDKVSLSERRNSFTSHLSSPSLSPRSTVLSLKPSLTSLHRTKSSNSKGTPSIAATPIWENPDDAPTFPPRRKTHWDTLLEEMRWMATDFIEEQKWKYATSRIFSVQASTFVSSKNQDQKPHQTKQIDANAIKQANIFDVVEVDKNSATIFPKEGSDVRHKLATSNEQSNFQSMTVDDILSTRTVAKQLSVIVANLVSTTTTVSGLDAASPHVSMHSNEDIKRVDSIYQSNMSLDELVNDRLNFSRQKAEFMQSASKHVDHILQMLLSSSNESSNHHRTTREKINMNGNEIQPSAEQMRTVQVIEDRWHRIGVGSVLHGARSSGKTIITCSLLWRNRIHGPQLLVCSSASLIRWMHELRNWNGLTVNQWNDSLPRRTFCANGVTVCHRSSMLAMHSDELSQFSSIVLDCRFAKESNRQKLCGIRTELSICVPNDLSSHLWWKKIIDAISIGNIERRLLIDSFDNDNFLPYLCGLSGKEFLDISALRTAFLIGTQCYVTELYPIGKAIIGWARHRTRQKASPGSKFKQVSSLLTDISASCNCSVSLRADNVDLLKEYISWDVRNCTMTQVQRHSYNRACGQARLLLSQQLDVRHEKVFENVAASLLLLRRRCFHSTMNVAHPQANPFLETSRGGSIIVDESLSSEIQQFYGGNASQPDLDLANRILSGSCKLRQLVSVLLREKGYNMLGVGQKKVYNKSNSDSTKNRNKIAIIAALPELQLVASSLLHSVGINHEILLARSKQCNNSSSWSTAQTILSKFNDNCESNLDVVITSLVSVEGDNVGLGIEAADIIIILDEDWSGLEENLLVSVLLRCSLKRKYSGKGSARVIRLVTKGTCEETFLRGEKMDFDHIKMNSCIATKAFSKEINGNRDTSSLLNSIFRFPGRNILRHRNKSIDEVLQLTKPSSRLHSLSKRLLFLPTLSGNASGNVESMLLSKLVFTEESTRTYSDQIETLQTKASISITVLPSPLDESRSQHGQNDSLSPNQLQDFLLRQIETSTLQENGTAVVNITLASRGTCAVEVSDRVERESRTMLTTSPSETALSNLLYTYDRPSDDPSILNDPFVSEVSGRIVLHDGNQGMEALVYCPPFVPTANTDEHQAVLQRLSSDEYAKSLILMVSRKRVRGQSNVSHQALYGAGVWNGMSSSISDLSLLVDVSGANKKGKKPVSAFKRLPITDNPQPARPVAFSFQRKDDYRHRLLSTLRLSSASSGATIMEAPIFRVAAVRIRDKITTRLHLTPSIQSASSRHKHIEIRNFGSSNGVSGMKFSRLRPRVGVTLPMGLKISSKGQTSVHWSQAMDSVLMESYDRFGANWILASQVLKRLYHCTSRNCEDRWHHLTKDNNESIQYPPDQVENDTGFRTQVSHISNIDLLIPEMASSRLPPPATDCKKKRRSFSSFQISSAREQKMPVPIAVVASVTLRHPSHELIVGRTDMWPLQILDGAERQRNGSTSTRPSHNRITTQPRPLSSSSAASGSQRPPTQNPYPVAPHATTTSKQSFVPPAHVKSLGAIKNGSTAPAVVSQSQPSIPSIPDATTKKSATTLPVVPVAVQTTNTPTTTTLSKIATTDKITADKLAIDDTPTIAGETATISAATTVTNTATTTTTHPSLPTIVVPQQQESTSN